MKSRICNNSSNDCKDCGHEKPHSYKSEKNTKEEPDIGWCSNKFCRKKNKIVNCKII